ncbi:MAG TPA: hypothetical protein DCS93_05850 [Microscillaceae bacterium]|nr:hypothetical protein [Microscillaceae bacterium]
MKSNQHSIWSFILFLLASHITYSQTTLTLQPGSAKGKDAFIWQLTDQSGRFGPTNTKNYGSEPQFIAHEWTWDGSVGTRRSLIDFDFSLLPANALVISAHLSLYGYPSSGDGGHSSLTGSNESLLQRITSAWDENLVTWNNRPTVTTQNQIKLSRSTSVGQDYLDIDVTNLVNDMLSNPTSAHGFMLSMQTQQHYRRLVFASSDHPDPLKRPKLVIIYSLDCTGFSVDLGKDQTLCAGEATTLDATLAGASYRWQDGSTAAQYTVTQAGTYWVEVTKNGCTVKDTVEVTYTSLPIANLGQDQTLCTGETTTLDATLAGASYRWQDGSTMAQYTVTQAGTYWVEVTKNGCTAKDTVEVTYHSFPVVNLGQDQILCAGETTTLDATTKGASYRWQDGSTTAQYTVIQAGTYWVEVTKNGCTTKDTVEVIYTSLPIVDLGQDQILCVEETTTLNAATKGASYRWQDGSTTAQYIVTQAGTYWVDVTKNGCSVRDSVRVSYNALPQVNLGDDIVLCNGATTTLNATLAGAFYRWQDGTTTAQYTVAQPGTYWVEVSLSGCKARDTIVVVGRECNVTLTFPNLITPNRDGKNDVFTPIIKDGILAMEIEVYNRWGTKVFSGTNASKLWDGITNSGEKAKRGLYFWVIRYEDVFNKKSKKTGWLKVLY